ncbi:EF-hand domain-containing protein [Streptomyces sp. CSDS2]|uniref:EF-hand domain-containing protein n=1 Tax=Streptomyces sp. CSDS2 TaxID=3055051 RepID=UPI0025B1271F|nr:EF-hand domain-containing protein [Streptomyces sp. CSDS2]MDN3263562.1 EF-hand domain-containing protein [Streptomyces sp. CSDS2]
MVTQTERDYFQTLFRQLDGDGDGKIAQVDLDQLVQTTLMRSGAVPGSERWRRITGLGNRLWDDLRAGLDTDEDGTVSAREFVTAYRRPEFLERTAIPFEVAVLEMSDEDGDGKVSVTEWLAWHQAKGVPFPEALKEFSEADADGDG